MFSTEVSIARVLQILGVHFIILVHFRIIDNFYFSRVSSLSGLSFIPYGPEINLSLFDTF